MGYGVRERQELWISSSRVSTSRPKIFLPASVLRRGTDSVSSTGFVARGLGSGSSGRRDARSSGVRGGGSGGLGYGFAVETVVSATGVRAWVGGGSVLRGDGRRAVRAWCSTSPGGDTWGFLGLGSRSLVFSGATAVLEGSRVGCVTTGVWDSLRSCPVERGPVFGGVFLIF